MQQPENDPIVALFLDQLKQLILRIYRYETIIDKHDRPIASIKYGNGGVDVTEINKDVLMILKLAAWGRFDSLVELGATKRAELVIESCSRIIAKSKDLPATKPNKQC